MNERPSDHDRRLAEVRQALAASRIDAAAKQAEAVLEDYPDDLRSHLLWSEVLSAQGKHADVADYCTALLDRWPENPWLLSRLVGAHMADGDIGAAISVYRARVEGSTLADDDKTRIARNLAAGNRRSADACALLERRIAVTPDDAALLRDIASAYLALGRLDDSLRAFSDSARRSPLPAWACMLRLNALIQRRRTLRTFPVVEAETRAILKDALTRFPSDPLFVRTFSRLPIDRPEWMEIYCLIRSLFDMGSPSGLLRFEVGKLCLQGGDFAEARQILEALDPKTRWGQISRPLLSVLDTVPQAVWNRARLEDDPAAEVQVVRTPGARTTIMVFATLTGNFMMLPIAGIDALLSELPANIIYLRDTMFGSGLAGLLSVGPDIGTTVAGLQRIVADLGAEELVSVGASVSGLAALRYGARLGADRVVTFGAMTTVDPEFHGTPVRMQRTLRGVRDGSLMPETERFEDVDIELTRAPDMHVDLHVGAACEFDLQQAGRLGENPRIRVHREAGVDHHYVALSMIARDRFRAAVAGLPA